MKNGMPVKKVDGSSKQLRTNMLEAGKIYTTMEADKHHLASSSRSQLTG